MAPEISQDKVSLEAGLDFEGDMCCLREIFQDMESSSTFLTFLISSKATSPERTISSGYGWILRVEYYWFQVLLL